MPYQAKGLLKSASLLLAAALLLSACGEAGSESTAEANAVQSQNEQQAEVSSEPAVESSAPSDAESLDKLIEEAKQEGKVVVYSPSGRATDAADTFMKKYPEIKVEVNKIKSDEMMDKVIREEEAGQYNPDVIVTKEVSGAVEEEMVKPGRYIKYLPDDIAPHVIEPYRTQAEGFADYVEFRTLFYNTNHYKEAPVTNWWDLTTPEFKGKVYAADPLDDPSFMNLFASMVVGADDMAAAYKEKFGKDIELHGTENAGYEFIKQLHENGLVLLHGSGDVLDAIGKGDSDAVAIAVTGDVSKVEENGWSVQPIYDIKPKTSVEDAGYLFLAKNAPHEAAAKLFLRWMMGEADGKGPGIDPFNEVGSWVPRDDVATKNDITFDKLNLWNYDGEGLYEATPKVRDFWIKLK